MVHAHHPLVRRRNRFDWGKLHWPGAAENIDARNAAPEPIAGPASGVQTLVSIVYITQSKTFDGPAVYVTLGQPLVNSRTTTAVSAATTDNSDDSSDDSVTSDPTTQATAATTTAKNTSAATTAAAAATTAVTSAIGAGTTHKATGTGTSIADASATASLTPKPGMSGGAKAALVLGLLIGIALVLGLILWLYKGKKRQQAMRRLSDEKSAYNGGPRTNAFRPATAGGASMHAPPSIVVDAPGAAPSVRSMATADTAPRLELRPVTQFAPMLGSDGRQSPRPSAWEKPGAANAANDPANPFGNHAETVENGAAKNTAVFGAAAVPSTNTRSPPRGPPAPIAPIAPGFRPGGPDSPKPLSVRSNASGVPGESREIPANEGPGPQAAGPIIPTGPSGQAGPPGHPALLAAAAGTRQPPPPGPPGINNVHRVQMDFNPSMEDELRIRAGQLVRMLHEYDDGWALCIRMDRSQQGVVPRTCLSKYPVKPRPTNGGPPPAPYRNYNGPGAPPNGPPVGPPVGPNMGMRGPPPPGAAPRPLSPAQPPYPMGNGQPRPSSPATGPMYAPQRPRAASGASHQQRSMSPGPYGPGGRPVQMADMRRRSNSMGQIQTQGLQQQQAKRLTPPSPLSAGAVNARPAENFPAAAPAPAAAVSPVEPAADAAASTTSPAVARKPVPGQAL